MKKGLVGIRVICINLLLTAVGVSIVHLYVFRGSLFPRRDYVEARRLAISDKVEIGENSFRTLYPIPKVKSHYFYFHPMEKPFGKIRIGCFGDSHTFGSEESRGNDFPSLLQEVLGEEQYEVLNFGVSGRSFSHAYLMWEYFKDKYDLDIIILGPKGMHYKRMVSFNPRWQREKVLTARHIISNGNLKLLEPSGRDVFEAAKRYFGIIPYREYFLYDTTPPSLLKLFSYVFSYPKNNPFYYRESPDSEAREIQFELLKRIIRDGKRVIHLVYEDRYFQSISSLHGENYRSFLIPEYIREFPFRARATHASSFGNLMLAKNLKEILSLKEGGELSRWPLLPLKYQGSAKVERRIDDFGKIGIWLGGVEVGSIGGVKSLEGGSDGKLLKASSNKHLVGIYNVKQSPGNAYFMVLGDSEIREIVPTPMLSQKISDNVTLIGYEHIEPEWHDMGMGVPAHSRLFEGLKINGKNVFKAVKQWQGFKIIRSTNSENVFKFVIYKGLDLSRIDFSGDVKTKIVLK